MDSAKLTATANKAANKAGLAKLAVSAFADCGRRYTYDPSWPEARIRFMKAARLVIVRNTVAKITAQLIRRERATMSQLPSALQQQQMQESTANGAAVGARLGGRSAQQVLMENRLAARRARYSGGSLPALAKGQKLKPLRPATNRGASLAHSSLSEATNTLTGNSVMFSDATMGSALASCASTTSTMPSVSTGDSAASLENGYKMQQPVDEEAALSHAFQTTT